MSQYPETSENLIVLVRDPHNRDAWARFVEIYRPVIYRTARVRGMQHADAQDLAQQVLVAVASSIDRFEKSAPSIRFRHWLRRVTRNAILNTLTRSRGDRTLGHSSVEDLLQACPAREPETESIIDLEYARELYLRAAAAVRTDVSDDTWRAFEMTVVDGVDKKTAAEQLGKSIGSVYAARSRVMRRLRDAVAELTEELE